MTEPAPTWPTSEREAQRQIVQALRDAGWWVRVKSQDIATRQQLSGEPDLCCIRWLLTEERPSLIFFEIKGPGGELNKAQEDWWATFENYRCPPFLDGKIVYCVQDVEQWC